MALFAASKIHTHTHKHTAKLSNSSPPFFFSFFFLPSLHNNRRALLRLHVQVGPLDCSPGLPGEDVERRRNEMNKQKRWWKGGPQQCWCVSSYVGACSLLHLLWKLTIDGEWYGGGGVGVEVLWGLGNIMCGTCTMAQNQLGRGQASAQLSALLQYPFPACTWRPQQPHAHPAHACVSEKSAPPLPHFFILPTC